MGSISRSSNSRLSGEQRQDLSACEAAARPLVSAVLESAESDKLKGWAGQSNTSALADHLRQDAQSGTLAQPEKDLIIEKITEVMTTGVRPEDESVSSGQSSSKTVVAEESAAPMKGVGFMRITTALEELACAVKHNAANAKEC